MLTIYARISLIAALITASAVIGAESDSQSTLSPHTFATLDWAPYIAQSGLIGPGYVYELVETVFNKMGVEAKINFYPWSRALKMAEAGQVAGCFPEYYNADYESKYIFSDPFPGGDLVFVKRADDTRKPLISLKMSDFTALRDYRIGVVRDYTNTETFDRDTTLKKDIADDDYQNLIKLLRGRVDLILIDENTANYLATTILKPPCHEKLVIIKPSLDQKPLYVCFSRAYPGAEKLAHEFNTTLKGIMETGIIIEMKQRHGLVLTLPSAPRPLARPTPY